ncbi:MAG TPA: hypothetical protein VGF53_08110 [Pseudolabrys sp.]|jgi:hypothetical protein
MHQKKNRAPAGPGDAARSDLASSRSTFSEYNGSRRRNLAPTQATQLAPRSGTPVLICAADIQHRARAPELVAWIAALKQESATDRGPRYIAGNRVRCISERLHPAHWIGRQWAVTSFGIEKRDGTYPIAFARLDAIDWISHLAGKMWIDLDDFAEALRIARRYEWVAA